MRKPLTPAEFVRSALWARRNLRRIRSALASLARMEPGRERTDSLSIVAADLRDVSLSLTRFADCNARDGVQDGRIAVCHSGR